MFYRFIVNRTLANVERIFAVEDWIFLAVLLLCFIVTRVLANIKPLLAVESLRQPLNL